MAYWFASLILLGFGGTPAASAEKLTLEHSIQLALDHSWSAKAGQFDSTAAHLDFRAAQADRYPSLSLEAKSFYVDDLIEVGIGLQPLEIHSHENYQADLRLSLPLFTGGKLSNNIELKGRQLEASTFELEADRLEVAYQTRRAYLSLLLAERLLAATEASLQRVQIVKDGLSDLHAVGLVDSLDLLEVEQAWLQATQLRQERQTNRTNATARLGQLLGIAVTDEIAAVDSLPTPEASQLNCRPTAAEIARPELQQLERQTQAAQATVGLAQAQYFPNLSAFAGYSGGMPHRDLFDKSWNDYFTVGAVLNWNLNLGNKVGRERQFATARVNSLTMLKAELLEKIRFQAEIACNNVEQTLTTYQSRGAEFQVAGQQYRLAQQKQLAGGLTINRLLELESELTTAEQLWRAAAVSYHLNLSDYLYALGAEIIYGGLQ
jgi:outer membrane protein TolC